MWKTVCRNCEWTSGEAYLQSVAEAIGRVHEEDHAGHKVVTKQVSMFGSDLGGTGDSESHGPEPSKS